MLTARVAAFTTAPSTGMGKTVTATGLTLPMEPAAAANYVLTESTSDDGGSGHHARWGSRQHHRREQDVRRDECGTLATLHTVGVLIVTR